MGRRSSGFRAGRAHQYERSFPEPDSPVRNRREWHGHRSDTGGALNKDTGQSAVPPDGEDMHLGRGRPLRRRFGTVIGGWQRGSLTPQMPRSLLLTAAPTAARAANSAARFDRGEVADRVEHRQVTRRRSHVLLAAR